MSVRITAKIPNINRATMTAIQSLVRQQQVQQQAVPGSLEELSENLQQMDEANNINVQLSNFRPRISGNNIQRRRTTNSQIEGTDDLTIDTKSKGRKKFISGVAPLTRQMVEQLAQLGILGRQKEKLLSQVDKLEAQITNISDKLAALRGSNAGVEELRALEQQLEQFSNLYDRTKQTLERIQALYDARYELLRKLREERDRYTKKIKDKYDKVMKILKIFRELPKKLRMPKRPKLPATNPRKSNIKYKISNVLNTIKSESGKAAKLSLDKSREESREKLQDPEKGDGFQKAMFSARKALGEAIARAESVQAAKQAAIDATINQVDNQVKRIRAGINSAKKQAEVGIDKAVAETNKALEEAKNVKARADTLRNSAIAVAGSGMELLKNADSVVRRAQSSLNNQIASGDITSKMMSPSQPQLSQQETDKINQFRTNITEFLSNNRVKNFTMNFGTGKTLREAKQKALSVAEFQRKYPQAVEEGVYDTISRISNVNGNYVVVLATYQTKPTTRVSMGNVGRSSN